MFINSPNSKPSNSAVPNFPVESHSGVKVPENDYFDNVWDNVKNFV